MISLAHPSLAAFQGWEKVFDERSGAMLGAVSWNDTPYGVCSRSVYSFGELFDCPDAVECTRCTEDERLLPELPLCAL